MLVRDYMTKDVVTVSPDTSTRAIARLLLDRTIGTVPVVDGDGTPIGMVSDGDLTGRSEADRRARRYWWLVLFAAGEEPESGILARLRTPPRTAREAMSTPVVTITEATEAAEAARLLVENRIKLLPVVRANRIVGVVGRTDLLRAFAAEEGQRPESKTARHGVFSDMLASIEHRFKHNADASVAMPRPAGRQTAAEGPVTLADFRGLVADFEWHRSEARAAARGAAAEMRRRRVRELIDCHIVDENWRAVLHRARQLAERGETEFMLLRFPAELCGDGGRAINAPAPNWAETLRGEAAEIYRRWRYDLQPSGFRLAARVLDFPGGVPGDIGLFLMWGE